MGAAIASREKNVYPSVEVWESLHAHDAAGRWLRLGPGEGLAPGAATSY